MIIQHNLPAMNSRRAYKKNASSLSKSLEKLSSGYRINRAGDNAAGLAVSEKMRSQIAGMKQAVVNSQDGISLIQTFEGALGETVAIIHRAKTLADQMANGSYDDETDRHAVEIEYLHLCDEVDQIAETDFNGVVMLTGGCVPQWLEDAVNEPEIAKSSDFLAAAAMSSAVSNVAANSATRSSAVATAANNAVTTAVASYASAAPAVTAVSYAAANRTGGVTCGDFTVYGNAGDYSFDSTMGVLTINGGDVVVEGTGAITRNTIVVAKDKDANVTLCNVNIISGGMYSSDVAFKIEDDSKGNVTINLEGTNSLKSTCGAGLQKAGGVDSGTLTIMGSGSLYADGGGNGAGIGGGENKRSGHSACNECSNIIIKSGIIEAAGGSESAGIGGGVRGKCNNIVIEGGTVTAYGGWGGAGIGSGYLCDCRDVTISGGNVVAYSGYMGAGIGSGCEGNAYSINILGGTVYASTFFTCDEYDGGFESTGSGAGIGGGHSGKAVGITISGGNVTALSSAGAGIGGGKTGWKGNGDGLDITISGGIVNAITVGYAGAAAIGGGGGDPHTINYGDGETIGGEATINICGGYITALNILHIMADNPESFERGTGCAIGGGYKNAGVITISGDDTIVIAKGAESSVSQSDDIDSNAEIRAPLISEIYTGYGNIDRNIKIIDEIIYKYDTDTGAAEIDDIIFLDLKIDNGTIIHGKSTAPDDNPDKPIKPDEPDVPEKLKVSIPNAFGNAAARLTYTDNLVLQVGSRGKDAVRFTFAYDSDGIGGLAADLNCTAAGLGMDALTLSTQEDANFAIDRLDHALNKVSMVRSTFGAAQNRLEHKIDNLNNSVENLTSAESTIRDTDMAEELMKFTKDQILTQAAQAMLAQANSLPQAVLSLISG